MSYKNKDDEDRYPNQVYLFDIDAEQAENSLGEPCIVLCEVKAFREAATCVAKAVSGARRRGL